MSTRRIYRGAVLALVLSIAAGLTWNPTARSQTRKPSGPQGLQSAPPAADNSADHQSMPCMPNMPNMPGMEHCNGAGAGAGGSLDPGVDDSEHHAERGAMSAMSPVGNSMHHHMGPHMYMTSPRTATPQDWAKADEIASEAREAIAKYKDYREAIRDGYQIFLPNIPQPEYHFTNYWNGFLESFSFDPARPTSLLYKKTKDGGWQLTGVMYTMPRSVSEDQLNERIPLSVAQWHLHTNLCMPARGQARQAAWSKFGLEGSIATREACSENHGTFYPVIFGWMVHVYPFEETRAKIWGQ